ncbi:MAG TPA: helix-turn-helix transcriptional regulator, partial [Myxococcota bacterium]|nr:helix-turn-helix transcriptional regulator [Myxococcota bacterium]
RSVALVLGGVDLLGEATVDSKPYERADAASRIRAARERAGLTDSQVAASIGINVSWYGDIEADDAEVFMTLSLQQLGLLASCLGLHPRDIVCSETAAQVEPIPMATLVRLIANQIEVRSEGVAQASERIGWDLTSALADYRHAWDDWNVDCLQDVARAVGVDWPRVLASWAENSSSKGVG